MQHRMAVLLIYLKKCASFVLALISSYDLDAVVAIGNDGLQQIASNIDGMGFRKQETEAHFRCKFLG